MTPAERLFDMASPAYMRANAIFLAATLDVATAFEAGPGRATDAARQLGLDPDALRRLLRALASSGVLDHVDPVDGEPRYALNELSRLLLPDVPGSMRALLRQGGRPWHHALWAQLPTAIRTGRATAPDVLGAPVYTWLQAHREEAVDFDQAKIAFSQRISAAVLDARRVEGHVVDVGGGLGHFLAEALHRTPALRGTLFDLPEVVTAAAAHLDTPGMAGRVALVGGDFFASIPAGGDLYYLMNVLHNWGDGDCVRILRRLREALAPGARAWIVEMVLPERCEGHFGALLDLEMLALFGEGRERTEREFRMLFDTAGLTLRSVAPVSGAYAILELACGDEEVR